MGKIYKNGIEYGGGGGGGTGGHTIVDTDGSPVADEPKLQFTGLDVQDNSTDSETEVAAFGLNTDSLDDVMSAGAAGNQVAGNGLVYSTTEQVVGKWVDGKPLYQKTLVNNNATSGRTSLQMGTIPDIDTIFITNGFYTNANQAVAPIGDSLSVNISGRGIGVSDLQYASYATAGKQYGVQVYYGESTASSKTIITVQYTKTTD